MAEEKDEYLGDFLHELGLGKSVEVTINHRYGSIFCSIIEISAILEDFRMDTIRGKFAGLEIFELALLPPLLNNTDTWIDISPGKYHKIRKPACTVQC